MALAPRKNTRTVTVGGVHIGGGAPIAVQSMTNTDTEDAAATAQQAFALAEAGSELVRVTVNTGRAAAALPEIAARLADAGCTVPIVGDFHYNGHRLLRECPDCAAALAKYRINPGNTGRGDARAAHFDEICAIAREYDKPIRIGVNRGSLDQDLLARRMDENARREAPETPEAVANACMVESALQSTERALACGLAETQIVLSVKTSVPVHLLDVYRRLANATAQPLHLGLTEAGMGMKGHIWSAAAMGALLAEGIGDTIRVSLTPSPGGDRCGEVYAAQELLQSLGLRRFAPSITACPGCGRTAGALFQELAAETEAFVRARLPEWRENAPGVESLSIAVMGCVVNGPGESQSADIGISLPGNGEAPVCPVYTNGEHTANLKGTHAEIAAAFFVLLEDYIAKRFSSSVIASEAKQSGG